MLHLIQVKLNLLNKFGKNTKRCALSNNVASISFVQRNDKLVPIIMQGSKFGLILFLLIVVVNDVI
jgi:hypothetical protein